MKYNFNKLYFSLVEYYNMKDYKLDVHALYKDNDTEELVDLDLSKPILQYGYEEKYFEKSLIPFSDILYRTRISWGDMKLGDIFKLKESYSKQYFQFLRKMGIDNINDLENKEVNKINKKQRRK